MQSDWRADVARYYDMSPHHPDDLPFYVGQLAGPADRVLELGCGTGRITIPLAAHCAQVWGVDNSTAMVECLEEKLAVCPHADRVRTSIGDITSLDLGERFDLVIAPFRVLQNSATDDQVTGLLRTIRDHLAPGGVAVLNAFNPRYAKEDFATAWMARGDSVAWEVVDGATKLEVVDRAVRIETDPLVAFPQLVYRFYEDGEQVDEALLNIAMRVYYPDELVALIRGAGFEVRDCWGGYAGEVYGEGSELVVSFTRGET